MGDRRRIRSRLVRAWMLAPYFRANFQAITRQQRGWCYPRGPAVVRVTGTDPVRVLLLGDGPAAGCGVLIHDLGVAGSIAREVDAATHRGAEVIVRAQAGVSAVSAVDLLRGVDLGRFDAIVLMLAATDVLCLTSRRRWQRSMTGLVTALASEAGRPLIVTATARVETATALSPLVRRVASDHARVLDLATSVICARFAVPLVWLGEAGDLTPEVYAAWGRRIGAHVSRSVVPAQLDLRPRRAAENSPLPPPIV